MSSVASQVVFHPVASQTLKMWSSTVGRDKTYRAVQYFSRFLAWYFLLRGNKRGAAQFNALKAHLALARKLMRLGKPWEHLQAALRAIHASSDPAEQITTLGRQFGYFGYLSYDTVVWANAVKLISLKHETAQRVARISNRFWLVGIIFSIAHGVLKLRRLRYEAKQLSSSKESTKNIGEEADIEDRLRKAQVARVNVRHQFIIDTLDIWIPATNLRLVRFNDGILGIFGFITSAMALRREWEAAAGHKH